MGSVNEFRKWALQVGIAIVVVVFVACFASAARSEPEAPVEACMPVEVLKSLAGPKKQFRNPRIVSDEMTEEAVKLFHFVTRGRVAGDYDTAMLVEMVGGGGILFVGHESEMCAYVIIPADNWYEVVKLLEGEKA